VKYYFFFLIKNNILLKSKINIPTAITPMHKTGIDAENDIIGDFRTE
jgi:hypothetical protein